MANEPVEVTSLTKATPKGLTHSLPLMLVSRLDPPDMVSLSLLATLTPINREQASNVHVSMHRKRIMMSAIQPSVAALEAGLMEQEQRYRCSVVLP
jgi:hypothetical protein